MGRLLALQQPHEEYFLRQETSLSRGLSSLLDELLLLQAHTTPGPTEIPGNGGGGQPWVRVRAPFPLPVTSVEPSVVTYRQTSE